MEARNAIAKGMDVSTRIKLLATCVTFACCIVAIVPTVFAQRPRLAVLTDIGGDPDDQQSMIRLLVYSNEFEIEALIASASGTRGELKESVTRPDLIHELIDAYETVLPNLKQHAEGWPQPEALRSVVVSGNPHRERPHIGQGHDTDGSRLLIQRIDAGTPKSPLCITLWGGQTDLAQALYSVKSERDAEGFAEFLSKFRVYDIADQDGIADWMGQEFPGMNYVLSAARPKSDKRIANFRGMYLTGDVSTTSREWIDSNVRQMGPLGSLYPMKTWTAPNPQGCLKEGDTPSWFFFLPHGGNDPNDPTQPGWGGVFEKQANGWYRDRAASSSYDPRTSVSRWRPEFQADFAKRMRWCLPSDE
ncbi:MAG TPA: DUF1593 domain-containing protein [Rhodopirellula baltica]|uniref:Cellulose-binding Sde182 nucleoside hydrolase-like domain-containing protein n=2 Tax=Rhodopirellula baltica TaxID=265606 RepID=Q7UTP2_RHOBA|nr:hypothetical protein-signal peptide and transmembrane prediction [Rhodopirellula baltica SH 1]HBE63020.1 DUF1593 domain-containing protein [Rhodopirellula baltica]